VLKLTDSRGNRIAKRILVIGLDGATFDVLGPIMDQGYMPHLKFLVDTGTSGILSSTKPPMTPAAWTTFMTGMGPGRHGVIDFEHYDPQTNSLKFNNTFQIKDKTIWQILSEKGFRVGSLHLPMTYPPQVVNGFMVSGFETPSIKDNFTYPQDLKDLILREIPDYTYSTNWKRGLLGGRSMFSENLEYFKRNFRQNVKLAQVCTETYGWDCMMVLFKLVDNIQHKCWKFLTPEAGTTDPTKQRMVFSCFQVLDECIGKLMDMAREKDATVLIMSDHGHGSLDGKAQPNYLLKQWGFLNLTSSLSQFKARVNNTWDRLTKKKGGRYAQPDQGIEHDLAIDWRQTKACVMHAGIYGFLYINLKGRQPQGIVNPVDYEPFRDELIQRLLSARDEKFGEPVFQDVVKPEEVYNCSRQDHKNLPDLMLIPRTGLAVVRKIRGFKAVKWALDGRLGGTHRVEGIFLANGPGVKPGLKVNAEIADITPTLLAMLGLAVPADMEGKALTDIFDPQLRVEFEPPKKYQPTEGPTEIYSEEEQKLLTQRLSDLGYLE
jgi:predicted AlkP superfamily phosphohydrolase/phosphomutase